MYNQKKKKKERKIHAHLGKDTYSTVLLHVSLLSLTACRQGLESCWALPRLPHHLELLLHLRGEGGDADERKEFWWVCTCSGTYWCGWLVYRYCVSRRVLGEWFVSQQEQMYHLYPRVPACLHATAACNRWCFVDVQKPETEIWLMILCSRRGGRLWQSVQLASDMNGWRQAFWSVP